MAKAKYSKPASQVDLEARQKDDYEPSTVLRPGESEPKSENGYVGVAPEYQTHANATEAPVKSDKGPEAKIFENFVSEDADYKAAATPEGEVEEDDDEEDKSPATPPSGSTPPSQ